MTKIYIEDNGEELIFSIEGQSVDVLVLYARLTYELKKHIPNDLIVSAMRTGLEVEEGEENDRTTNN